MTPPRPLTAGTLASSAEHGLIAAPSLGSLIHVPRRAFEIGRLPSRLSTFHPPRPSLEGISRSASEASRPAGAARHHSHPAPHETPGVPPPPGIQHFTVRPGTRDAENLRSLGQSLLRFRPSSGARAGHSSVTPESTTSSTTHLTHEETRRYVRDFRNAMADYRRAMYFGGEDRIHTARSSLTAARAAYTMLYAELPNTPAMNDVLGQFQSQLEAGDTRIAALDPSHPHRSRLASRTA